MEARKERKRQQKLYWAKHHGKKYNEEDSRMWHSCFFIQLKGNRRSPESSALYASI